MASTADGSTLDAGADGTWVDQWGRSKRLTSGKKPESIDQERGSKLQLSSTSDMSRIHRDVCSLMTEYMSVPQDDHSALAAQPDLQTLVDTLASSTDAADEAYYVLERLAERVWLLLLLLLLLWSRLHLTQQNKC